MAATMIKFGDVCYSKAINRIPFNLSYFSESDLTHRDSSLLGKFLTFTGSVVVVVVVTV